MGTAPSVLIEAADRCRVCGGGFTADRVQFGDLRVSDFPFVGHMLPPRVPLNLNQCGLCGLVQLSCTYSRHELYDRKYWYRSGTNESMRAALRDIVETACAHAGLAPGDRVLDIGCNDGTLLTFYPEHISTFGIEPSALAEDARAVGATVARTFWSAAPELDDWCDFKVITAIAMFYSVADPHAFLARVERALAPGGIFILQLATWANTLAGGFDNICHEHIFYYEERHIVRLAAQHGLALVESTKNNVNGGSERYIFRRGTAEIPENVPPVGRPLQAYAQGVKGQIEEIGRAVRKLPRPIYGYGASTKGNTLLQLCEMNVTVCDGVAERAPEKFGRMTATGIPIVSEDEARKHARSLFVLPWHFIEGILVREKAFLAGGGVIMAPLPTVQTHRG